MTSAEGYNLVVFYYLSPFEIWPDKKGSLWWEWPDKRAGFLFKLIMLRTIVLKAVFLISHSLFTKINICPKSLQSLGHFQNL